MYATYDVFALPDWLVGIFWRYDMVKPLQDWPKPDDSITVEREFETITITSPVTATVKAQIEVIMSAIDLVKQDGTRSLCLRNHPLTEHLSTSDDLHPRAIKLLEAAEIRVDMSVPRMPLRGTTPTGWYVKLIW